jgi:predicted phosphodiesterase
MHTRRHFIVSLSRTVAACGVLPSVALAGETAAKAQAQPVPLPPTTPAPGIPTAQLLGQHEAVIVWGVGSLCTGLVEYGETEALGRNAHGAEFGMRPLDAAVLRVPLAGLAPGKKIFYRTVTAPVVYPNRYGIKRGEGIVSPIHSFIVPPSDAKDARIAVWNDTHGQAPTLAALRAATEKFGPDILVLNGDLIKDEFMLETDLCDTFLGEDKGVATSLWPTFFVRGNHDTLGVQGHRLPQFAPPAHATGYHALLRVGPVAALFLDTGDCTEGDNIYAGLRDFIPYRQTQAPWLETAIQDPRFVSAPFRLLICHIALRWRDVSEKGGYCSNGDELWSPILAQGKVQAVISGHTHSFWHDKPTAARPFHQIVGGGPETISTGWSPTPATLTEVFTAGGKLNLRVAEVVSGKELLSLALDPV